MLLDSAPALLTALLLCMLTPHAAVALKCYDCLSVALAQCSDDSMFKEFDTEPCAPDEKYCSVLKLKDSQGAAIVSRQCSLGVQEADNLVKILESQIQTTLTLDSFDTCEGDLCNVKPPSSGSSGIASATASFALLGVALAVARVPIAL